MNREIVRRVGGDEISSVQIAMRVIAERDLGPTDALEEELNLMLKHLEALEDLAEQMKLGSAMAGHTEKVIDYLIAKGWTPPPDTFLLNKEER